MYSASICLNDNESSNVRSAQRTSATVCVCLWATAILLLPPETPHSQNSLPHCDDSMARWLMFIRLPVPNEYVSAKYSIFVTSVSHLIVRYFIAVSFNRDNFRIDKMCRTQSNTFYWLLPWQNSTNYISQNKIKVNFYWKIVRLTGTIRLKTKHRSTSYYSIITLQLVSIFKAKEGKQQYKTMEWSKRYRIHVTCADCRIYSMMIIKRSTILFAFFLLLLISRISIFYDLMSCLLEHSTVRVNSSLSFALFRSFPFSRWHKHSLYGCVCLWVRANKLAEKRKTFGIEAVFMADAGFSAGTFQQLIWRL